MFYLLQYFLQVCANHSKVFRQLLGVGDKTMVSQWIAAINDQSTCVCAEYVKQFMEKVHGVCSEKKCRQA